MKHPLNFLLLNRYRNFLCLESKRFAGHSKWQNIKHTKEAEDARKAEVIRNYLYKMKVAITEHGSFKPIENARLAKLIEQARKACVPVATINGFLDKMAKLGTKSENVLVELRGPSGCILIVHVATGNVAQTRININAKIKKLRAKAAEPTVRSLFDCGTYITAQKDCNIDQATDDAIQINVEEVEEIKDDSETYFQFKCDMGSSSKVLTQLKTLNYNVISTEDVCVPKAVIELSEDELQIVNQVKEKLLAMDEVEKIDDNIAT